MRNILYFFTILLIQSAWSQVTFQWVQRASLPAQGKWGAVTFAINGSGYVSGGNAGGSYFSDMWRYDPINDSWSQVASMPQGRSHGTSFSINGKGYVLCGHMAGTFFSNSLWEYDPDSDQWQVRAPLPGNARYSPHGFAIGGFGYVGGGNAGSATGPYLSDMYKYDPSTDQWTEISGIPDLARYGSTGFAIGGYGYVHGGRISSLDFPNELWRFDPSTSTWSAVQSMPGPGRSWMMVMPYSNDAVITGGAENGITMDDAYWYTPSTNTWSAIPDYPGASGWSGASCTLFGRPFGGLGHVYPQNTYHTDWWELVKVDAIGLDEIDLGPLDPFIVHPNPVPSGSIIHLKYPVDDTNGLEILLMDALGRQVNRMSFNNEISLHGLSSGAYTMIITDQRTPIAISQLMITD